MLVNIELTGTQPLLMHHDDVAWSERLKKWQMDPDNKDRSVAGDDRSPAWSWLGSLYHDGNIVTMDSNNIMTMLREGGTQMLVPGGKSGKTFKAQTQSGIIPIGAQFPLTIDGETIPVAELVGLRECLDFDEHLTVVRDLGFDLLVKRAKVGQSKHVRVRPIFREWTLTGKVEITDEAITLDIFERILALSGTKKGLGDWRPSSPKSPGPYGTFIAVCEVA